MAEQGSRAVVPAVVAERGKRLRSKAQQGRPTASIARLQTAGTAAMKRRPAHSEFAEGAEGDAAWAAATRNAAAGFALATRQRSTDGEHVTYMLEWNELLEVRVHDCVRA